MPPPTIAIKLSALLAIALLGLKIASGQTTPATSIAGPSTAVLAKPIEAAGTFAYLHTNAPPGGCGCFSMYGGSGSAAYYYSPYFALVADFSFVHQGNVNNTGKSLSFSSYLFGARVPVPLHHARIVPFGQVLLGVTHDSGAVAQVSATNFQNASVVTAAGGGGLDYRLTPRLTVRTVQVDYLITQFPNGVNNRQNDLRINSGLALRF